jgi:hypothetical protein
MCPALQTPPLLITQTNVKTPQGESYTHVSMLFFVMWFEPSNVVAGLNPHQSYIHAGLSFFYSGSIGAEGQEIVHEV